MSLHHDQRGQSVVVGTIILFGFLILALSLYQVEVVPVENSEVEFEHTQDVEQQFLELRNTVLNVATTGASRSTSLQLGTRYPSRTVAINPPAPIGTVETSPERTVAINATVASTAHENIRSFWNTTPTFPTRSLQYTPEYNEYRNPPQLVYEHSYVAADFDAATLLRTNQTLVRGQQLSIPTLTGTVRESGVAAESLDVTPVSQQTRTVPLTGAGSPIEIRLPTATDNTTQLVDRLSIPGTDTAVDSPSGDAVVITLNGSKTYQLGLSAVSVRGGNTTAPAYIIPVSPERVSTDDQVVVEVRDKYNNPVSGATVTFESTGETAVTGANGRVTTSFSTSGSATVSINGNTEPYERVTFDVRATTTGNGSGDPVVGPNVTVVPADQNITVTSGDLIEFGTQDTGDVTIAGSITSVGTAGVVRSGTPIQAVQYDVVNPTGTEFITDAQYARFNPDASTRTFPFSEIDTANGLTSETLIDTSSWQTGTNTLRVTAQDATGRITQPAEAATVAVTVQDGSMSAPQYPTRTTVNNNDGSVSNPDGLQADDGDNAQFNGEGGGGSAFDVSVVTEGVPAGDYTLETEVVADSSFQGGGVDVTVTDSSGAQIGSGTIDSTGVFSIDLDPSAAGDITVRYTGRNQNSDLVVDFQRLA